MSEFVDFLNCDACQTSNEIYTFIVVGVGMVFNITIGGIILSYVAVFLDSMNEISLIIWLLYVVLLIIWLFVLIPCPIYVWCGFRMCNAWIKSTEKARARSIAIYTLPTIDVKVQIY